MLTSPLYARAGCDWTGLWARVRRKRGLGDGVTFFAASPHQHLPFKGASLPVSDIVSSGRALPVFECGSHDGPCQDEHSAEHKQRIVKPV